MKNKNDIQKHIDKLLESAEEGEKITTSASFMDSLNSKLDALDQTPQAAKVYSMNVLLKYAAIFLITVLNVGVVATQFGDTTTVEIESSDTISEFSDEYFPDYTAYTE